MYSKIMQQFSLHQHGENRLPFVLSLKVRSGMRTEIPPKAIHIEQTAHV